MATSLARFDPFSDLVGLRDRLFSEMSSSTGRHAAPTTDIYTEDDSKLTVEAHLPGFAEKDVDVDIDGGALVIRAQREERETEGDKKKKYVVRESSSSYYRRIILPEQADEGSVTATFDQGVLRVTVPYKSVPSPRKVEITPGS
ncbi:Hsp20/alpha crystallin family protein [Agromyces humatus]|uniref:Hsp20/alpha crystallin family protein n=1 Tax=Agromyces humatus TaxID=279573 RepID=A0ABN2KJ83_9MICO|nr:Hsp20/alpha crystallin family protein [Agromyces humatus]